MLSLLVNKIYRFNVFLDKNELSKLIILLFISIGLFDITLGSIIFGVFILSLICLLSLVRYYINIGSLKFNRDLYNVPEVDENIIITKKFYWDGSFRKYINVSDPSRKPNFYTINVGDEFRVISLLKEDADWEITMMNKFGDKIVINYFESRKYWLSKSDIRSDKLKKIGI